MDCRSGRVPDACANSGSCAGDELPGRAATRRGVEDIRVLSRSGERHTDARSGCARCNGLRLYSRRNRTGPCSAPWPMRATCPGRGVLWSAGWRFLPSRRFRSYTPGGRFCDLDLSSCWLARLRDFRTEARGEYCARFSICGRSSLRTRRRSVEKSTDERCFTRQRITQEVTRVQFGSAARARDFPYTRGALLPADDIIAQRADGNVVESTERRGNRAHFCPRRSVATRVRSRPMRSQTHSGTECSICYSRPSAIGIGLGVLATLSRGHGCF